jgi:hypothetical protein
LDDEELRAHMQIVGAKWGFALHWKVFDRPIGCGGGAWVTYWSNANRIRGAILPSELEAVLPSNADVLAQGKKSSASQFEYVYRIVEDKAENTALFFITCDFSIAFLVVTSDDACTFEAIEQQGAFIHRPTRPMIAFAPWQLGPELFRIH